MDKLNDATTPFDVDGAAAKNRTASLSEVAERLRDCLEELDRLQVWRVGAHVSQAISDLEVEICNSL
jgi:chloramphenicol 3-O-phosphotransferase